MRSRHGLSDAIIASAKELLGPAAFRTIFDSALGGILAVGMGSEAKPGLVRGVFDRVAKRYDLMNDLMSGGVHRVWKDAVAARLNPQPGELILDVAGGTGDIALRIVTRTRSKGGA